MKLDQETLKKHRFWFLLLLFVPMWLIIVFLLLFSVAGDVSASRSKVEASNGKLKSFDSKNQSFIDPLKKKEEALKDQKNKVWQTAWDGQDGLMTWPSNQRALLSTKLKEAYFGDPIEPFGDRVEYGDNLYRGQFDELTPLIRPAYFQSGSMDTVVRPIANWKNPTSEELWLAQEDFWVKREMLRVVRNAIDSVAKFKPVDPNEKDKDKPLPPGVVARQRFRNPNWEIELLLERNDKKQLIVSEKSVITNINPNQRLQTLNGVTFRVSQHTKDNALIDAANWFIEGEPVKYNASTLAKKSALIETLNPDQPMEVEQVFTWATSPVKRVDRIEIGNRLALSSRMASWGLVSKPIGKKDEKEGEVGGGGPVGGGPMGGGPMGGGPMGGGPMGGGPPPVGGVGSGGGPPGMGGGNGNNAAAVNATPNGLERDRYLDISDQARRMPVAMVLVVDQAYVPDVLTAFTNSRLRLWTTQWEWQHVRGITPPPPEGAVADGGRGPEGPMGGVGGPPRPGVGGSAGGPPPRGGSAGGPPPRMGSGGGPPPGMGPMGGFGPMGGIGGNQITSVDEDDPNLVELAVYNLATLYERYPPRSAKPEDNKPGTPGTPMPPTPPRP